MALDFLSSDIVFPSESNEPKLAPGAVSKLPEPVDWAFHDLYSTAHEKASMPLHSLTDYASLYPLHDDDGNGDRNEDELAAFNNIRSQNKSDQSLSLVSSHHQLPSLPSSAQTSTDQQRHMRAVLCGALKAVNNSMQDNHLTRLDKYKPSYSTSDQAFRWEDELLLGWANNPTYELDLSNDYPNYCDDGGRSPSSFSATVSPVLEDDKDFEPSSSPLQSSLGSSPSFVVDYEDHLFVPSPPSPSESFRYVLPQPLALPEVLTPPMSPVPLGRNCATTALEANTTRLSTPASEGKPAIAKSKVWQGLVSRLKKNLALSKPKDHHQDHDQNRPQRLKRFFKSRQN